MLLQTIFIYTILTIVMFCFCNIYAQTKKWRYVVWAISFYALVFGIRYGVGVDHLDYLDYYNWGFTDEYAETMEVGFKSIGLLLYNLGIHSSVFFGLLAFIQMYLLSRFFKDRPEILPFFTLAFMLGSYWLTFCNGLRQITAFTLFAFSIPFICKKKYLRCFACFSLAISMHSSAWLLLPVYFALFYREEWFSNIKLQLFILLVVLCIGTSGIISPILKNFDFLITALGYDNYTENGASELVEVQTLGLGYYIQLVTNIILVIYSNRVKLFFSDKLFNKIYDLFYIGVVFKYLFLDSMMLSRINYYFIYFQVLVLPFALFYLLKKNQVVFIVLLGLISLVYVATLYRADSNTAMYYTIWQELEYKNPIELR